MLATILVAIVALIHLYILVLEMFLWNTKTGHKAFNLSPDFARDTRVLAANQGLYNGFLAAGNQNMYRFPERRMVPLSHSLP